MTGVMAVAIVAVFSASTAHPVFLARGAPPPRTLAGRLRPSLGPQAPVAQSPTGALSLPQQPAPAFFAPRDKPYRGIFGGSAQPPWPIAVKSDTPRVVCGLTVIQVDPKVDARMMVRPKPGRTVVPKARIIEPKVCR